MAATGPLCFLLPQPCLRCLRERGPWLPGAAWLAPLGLSGPSLSNPPPRAGFFQKSLKCPCTAVSLPPCSLCHSFLTLRRFFMVSLEFGGKGDEGTCPSFLST